MNPNLVRSPRILTLVVGCALVFSMLACVATGCGGEAKTDTSRPGTSVMISGPYTHENLAVYFVHGPDRLAGKKLLALDEALRENKVVVHETRSVNRLAIENRSDETVFAQAGDIVKGGQQDRSLAVDLIVPPRSGKVPVDAFCVEHGRWTRRGAEPAYRFSGSPDALATKELKLASRQRKKQRDVWAAVAAAQEKLREKAGAESLSPISPSSMQLTMESGAVKGRVQPYLERLSKAPDEKGDVVGCAFAVNGRLSSADIYASPALFRALWPKLLKAGAVEALGETGAAVQRLPSADAVREFVGDPPSGKRVEEEIGGRTKLITVEGRDRVLFESSAADRNEPWLRRNVVSWEPDPSSSSRSSR